MTSKKSLIFPVLLAVIYIVYVCYRQYFLLYNFEYRYLDMSIYHHSIWQMSQFKEPVMTIMGHHVNIFGVHSNFINILFVPLYWIKSTPLVLLWAETIAIGISGFIIYLIARIRLQSCLMGLFIALVFYFYPATHYLNFDNYHPVAFALLFMLIYWYGYLIKKNWICIISAILLCSVKENTALMLVGLATYQYIFKKWEPARWYILFGLIYTVLIFFFVMPNIRGFEGNIITESAFRLPIKEIVDGNFSRAWSLTRPSLNFVYMKQLFSPLAFIPTLKPFIILLSSQLWLNLTTLWKGAHIIRCHYTAGIIGVIFIALIDSIRAITVSMDRIQIHKSVTMFYMAAVLAAGIIINNDIDHKHFKFKNILTPPPKLNYPLLSEIEKLKIIVGDKSVSTRHTLIQYFSEREEIYKWGRVLGLNRGFNKTPCFVVLTEKDMVNGVTEFLEKKGYTRESHIGKLSLFKKL